MIFLYNLILLLALILGSPWWLYRLATSRRNRTGLRERLGAVPPGVAALGKGKRSIWVHAVSLGETVAAQPLIKALRKELADAGLSCEIFVSATTPAGYQVAKRIYGDNRVFYSPLDFRFAVRPYLNALNPCALVLMESEFWPNLITMAAGSGAKVLIANARISDRSLPRYKRLYFFWRSILGSVAQFNAQTVEDAKRLVQMGAQSDRIRVSGNMKFDVPEPEDLPIVGLLRANLPPGLPVLVCGSTLHPEERELLSALERVSPFVPGLITIFAPRQPERFDAVAKLLPAGCLRRSAWAENPRPIAPGSIMLLDSIGELASVYSIATAAFIGGSLIPAGGHNPLEPIVCGVPVVTGRHMENFREVASVLRHCGALSRAGLSDLSEALHLMLQKPEQSAELGQQGRAALESNRGATGRTVRTVMAMVRECGL